MIGLAALVTAGLTLVSGFGLGTLLLPLFALFFPLEVAVAATAIVHGANNAFKIALVGRQADRSLVLTFGLPAILAALAGASALSYMSHFGELLSYSLGPSSGGNHTAETGHGRIDAGLCPTGARSPVAIL